jgi:predicted Zn-dependent protease
MTEFMAIDSNLTESDTKDGEFLDYFSSHPTTQKRVELANRYSECFKQGLTTCN